jgi:uncharacterized protein (TIGR03000 family)
MGTPIKPDATKAPTAPEPKPADPTKKTGTGMGANIKFKVPAAAKLFVDGKLTVLTGSERTFTTPPLAMGEKYYYEVKAELAVGGKVIVEEKRVIVEAGSNLTESFPTLVAAAEGKPTTVAGK